MESKNKVGFIPAENKVLVRNITPEKSAGGLILDKVQEGDATQKAEVWASSAEGYAPDDIVLYNKFAALPIKLKEGKFLLASKEALLGKIVG